MGGTPRGGRLEKGGRRGGGTQKDKSDGVNQSVTTVTPIRDKTAIRVKSWHIRATTFSVPEGLFCIWTNRFGRHSHGKTASDLAPPKELSRFRRECLLGRVWTFGRPYRQQPRVRSIRNHPVCPG